MFEFSYIVRNDSIVDIQLLEVSKKQVYEVIRFIDGLPVFFDEHFDRFLSSCALAGVSYGFDRELLAKLLVGLAQKNGVQSCNLKYLINVFEDSVDFYAGFIGAIIHRTRCTVKECRLGCCTRRGIIPMPKF